MAVATGKEGLHLVGLDGTLSGAKQTVAQIGEAQVLITQRVGLATDLARLSSIYEGRIKRITGDPSHPEDHPGIKPIVDSFIPQSGDFTPLVRPELGNLGLSKEQAEGFAEQIKVLAELRNLPQTPSVKEQISALEKAISKNSQTVNTAVEESRQIVQDRIAADAKGIEDRFAPRIAGLSTRIAEIDSHPGVIELKAKMEAERIEQEEKEAAQRRRQEFQILRTRVDAMSHKMRGPWEAISKTVKAQIAQDFQISDIDVRASMLGFATFNPGSREARFMDTVKMALKETVSREMVTLDGAEYPPTLLEITPWLDVKRKGNQSRYTFDSLQVYLSMSGTAGTIDRLTKAAEEKPNPDPLKQAEIEASLAKLQADLAFTQRESLLLKDLVTPAFGIFKRGKTAK